MSKFVTFERDVKYIIENVKSGFNNTPISMIPRYRITPQRKILRDSGKEWSNGDIELCKQLLAKCKEKGQLDKQRCLAMALSYELRKQLPVVGQPSHIFGEGVSYQNK